MQLQTITDKDRLLTDDTIKSCSCSSFLDRRSGCTKFCLPAHGTKICCYPWPWQNIKSAMYACSFRLAPRWLLVISKCDMMERIFWSTPNRVLTAHTLSGCQVCDWGIQYHLCSIHIDRGLWGLVVTRLSWLSGKALAAQARGVLGSTPRGCRLFRFPLFLPHNI